VLALIVPLWCTGCTRTDVDDRAQAVVGSRALVLEEVAHAIPDASRSEATSGRRSPFDEDDSIGTRYDGRSVSIKGGIAYVLP